MLKIFCDETWTNKSDFPNVKLPTIVFYGVMLDELAEEPLLREIEDFKQRRGLLPPEKTPIEIKWHKAEDEHKESKRTGKQNRYKEFLDIFFREVKLKRLSFGYMFLGKRQYDDVEKGFLENQSDNKQNFFFMMYFQFLYHCFIKNQVKQSSCEIWIDNHDMGGEGQQYEIGKLKEILNKRIYKEYVPKGQLALSTRLKKQLVDSIRLVSLTESRDEPIVQLADLCAGCVRYVVENQLEPPRSNNQMHLFEPNVSAIPNNGRESLANYFYSQLKQIKGYDDINLLKISYHYRFNIFPFVFQTK